MPRWQVGARASLAAVVALACATPLPGSAQFLPKSGTLGLHSGFRSYSEATVQTGESRALASGMASGLLFNDAGQGPFQGGWAACNYAAELNGVTGSVAGSCVWTDADGDKAFGTYEGRLLAGGLSEGINRLAGGTGKFAGIRAEGRFRCKSPAPSLYSCTQQFAYTFP